MTSFLFGIGVGLILGLVSGPVVDAIDVGKNWRSGLPWRRKP